jgi:predicted secreted Zn-dependent protease
MRILLVLCLLGIKALAGDEVAKVIRTDYYEVSGTNAEALLASMKEHRPYAHNAYTDWHIDWNYEFLIKSNECVLRSFDTRIQIRYALPKRVGSARADKSLRQEWNRFLAATMVHERGHSDLGIAAAKEMMRVVRSRDWRAADRKALKALVDGECERILKDFHAQEVSYDEKTDHGRTQNARLKTGR